MKIIIILAIIVVYFFSIFVNRFIIIKVNWASDKKIVIYKNDLKFILVPILNTGCTLIYFSGIAYNYIGNVFNKFITWFMCNKYKDNDSNTIKENNISNE